MGYAAMCLPTQGASALQLGNAMGEVWFVFGHDQSEAFSMDFQKRLCRTIAVCEPSFSRLCRLNTKDPSKRWGLHW
jgi:hypothetical protein